MDSKREFPITPDRYLPILKTLKIQQLDVQPLEIFSEDEVHENLISLEDEFTKWRVIIYSE